MMHGRHNLRKPALAIVLLAAILVAAVSIALLALYVTSASAAPSTYQDYDSTGLAPKVGG